MEDFYIPGPTVPGTIQVEFYGLKMQRKRSENYNQNITKPFVFFSNFIVIKLIYFRIRYACLH